MKYFKLNLKGLSLLLTAIILLSSCNKENSIIDDETQALAIESALEQSEIDDISTGIDGVIENVYFNYQNSLAFKNSLQKSEHSNSMLSDCTTVSKVVVENLKTITIDFGDGCLNKNDNFISGKIIMEIAYNLNDGSVIIENSFDNFYFNHKKIEGEIHKIKFKSNSDGNPQATINKNIKIIWEDGSYVTVEGERNREWIEGYGNKIWSDNVFLITGSWIITQKNGKTRTSIITEPLKRNSACKFLVSGIVEINKDDEKIILNYGDGECNDLAIVTYNGIELEIHLKKIRRK